jgi:hypothetical protein
MSVYKECTDEVVEGWLKNENETIINESILCVKHLSWPSLIWCVHDLGLEQNCYQQIAYFMIMHFIVIVSIKNNSSLFSYSKYRGLFGKNQIYQVMISVTDFTKS